MTHRLILAAVLLLPMFATAQAADPCSQSPTTCATLINTHATSRTRIANTAVDVALTITFNDKDLPSVQRTISSKSTALLSYLRTQQVQRLITTSVSFEPETKYKDGTLNKTIGYNGILKISFRTTPDKASDLLTGVLANGATSIDRTVFTPTEEEIAAARRQLSADATKTAMAQAEAIAAAAGMHVVSLRQINVNDDFTATAAQFQAGFLANSVMEYKTRDKAPMSNADTSAGDEALAITVNLVAAASHQ